MSRSPFSRRRVAMIVVLAAAALAALVICSHPAARLQVPDGPLPCPACGAPVLVF